jgi:hypothetical protein
MVSVACNISKFCLTKKSVVAELLAVRNVTPEPVNLICYKDLIYRSSCLIAPD